MTFRVCVIFGVFLMPAVAVAHHSFATTFDQDVVRELEGVVIDVRWRNPHVAFTLATSDPGGLETLWSIESHSLSIMRRMDLPTAFIRTGDRIKVAGNPARRRDINGLFAQHILLPSGEEWVFRVGAGPADLRWSDRPLGTAERWFATDGETSEPERGIFRVWSSTFSSFGSGGWGDSLTDSAKAAVAAFDPVENNPLANCAPKGMPTIMFQPYPMEFVDRNETIMLRIEEYDTVRTIHMESSASAEGQPRSLLGYSQGRWENDSLVIRTVGVSYPYYGESGVPQGDAAEFVERFATSGDGSQLDYRLTITDPVSFKEPVMYEKSWLWLPDVAVEPYDCTTGD